MYKTLLGLLLASAAWAQTLNVGDINDGSHDGYETKKSIALTDATGSITCSATGFWDQGWGYQKSRVRLALVDSDGNTLATEDCFGVAPHQNQGAVSKTFGCDSDLASKTKAGTTLHVQTVVGGGGGHYIYVRGLMVELGMTLNVGNVADQSHDSWETKGSQALVSDLVSVECKASSFNDQGWGNQKSRVRLALADSTGAIVAAADCFGVAPHTNQGAKSTTFDRSNDVVSMAKSGYTMHLQTYVGGGGGHQIFVNGLMAVFKTACFGSDVLSVGNISDNSHDSWESKGEIKVGGYVETMKCEASNYKDQGWGYQKSYVRLVLFNTLGQEIATQDCFGVAPHSWSGPKSVTFDKSSDIVFLAQPGHTLQVQTHVGGGGGHQIFVNDLTVTLQYGPFVDPCAGLANEFDTTSCDSIWPSAGYCIDDFLKGFCELTCCLSKFIG